MVSLGPHSAVRIYSPASGVIGFGTSQCVSTACSDSGYSQGKRSDVTFANYSYQRSQQSKGDKKIHLGTERKPRGLEFSYKMTSNMNNAGTTSEALEVLKNWLQRDITVDWKHIDCFSK
ncbi:unnamed protein product [Calypogeia fissa]